MSKSSVCTIAAVALALTACTAESGDAGVVAGSPGVVAGSRGPSSSASTSDSSSASPGPSALAGEADPGPLGSREPVETEESGLIGTNELPASELDQSVALEEGIEFTVVSAEDVIISAQGPGEVSGAGLAVRVEVRNATVRPLDLAGVVVDLTVGDEPGILSFSAPADPFSGEVEPGARATATYAFLIPEGASGDRVVRVEHDESENVMVVVL